MYHWCNGSISAFQAFGTSSNLVWYSIKILTAKIVVFCEMDENKSILLIKFYKGIYSNFIVKDLFRK